MRHRRMAREAKEHVLLGTDAYGKRSGQCAKTAPEGCLFAHPPSARTRAVRLTAARLTTPWPCSWPSETLLYENSPSPKRRQRSKV